MSGLQSEYQVLISCQGVLGQDTELSPAPDVHCGPFTTEASLKGKKFLLNNLFISRFQIDTAVSKNVFIHMETPKTASMLW